MNKDLNYFMSLNYPIVETQIIYNRQILSRVYLKDIPAIEAIDKSKERALYELEDVKREWFIFAMDEGIKIPKPPARAVFSAKKWEKMYRNFKKFSLLKNTPTHMNGACEDYTDVKPIRKASWYVNGVKLPNIVDIKITPHGATFTIEAGLRQVEYK